MTQIDNYRLTYHILGYPNQRTGHAEFYARSDAQAFKKVRTLMEEAAQKEKIDPDFDLEAFRKIPTLD